MANYSGSLWCGGAGTALSKGLAYDRYYVIVVKIVNEINKHHGPGSKFVGEKVGKHNSLNNPLFH